MNVDTTAGVTAEPTVAVLNGMVFSLISIEGPDWALG